ncbi:MAG: hypothetical protein IPG66_06175 [Hydrogenophilales bacterium]|nr:hypothetical protein [Hydrogenophilales bacterium]
MQTNQIGHLAKKCFNIDLPLQVCDSTDGFYIGTVHPKDGPYSRESREYFPTRKAAEQALDSGQWSQLDFDL